MDWSIQETARMTGTTSRTLRHYDAIGLLPPTYTADNGYRYYDETGLVRLQRILLLRELGMPLNRIAEALEGTSDPIVALGEHVHSLGRERARIERQIAAVTATIARLEAGEPLMAEEMFDGFDHRRHKEEVTRRWGQAAYESSALWWESMSADDRRAWKAKVDRLSQDWANAAEAGVGPESERCQDLARRHVQWLRAVPGTPANDPDGDLDGYVRGLADMYVSDPRFGANYGGTEGAELVRDSLNLYLDANADS
ncbi:MerR family transcriptional regulator [Brevibacterium sp. UCMA 11754]|uniref:MerR family transcriptional regulator n=1 Tax=Brevibacterium sp. UCMA 11754 TaxID=2749198 RepID=UPI001F3939E5|nr:MerR family transcriptional regulator [Brevibacterium sp. UCMA 11754]MCF2574377.1 MerR family transcriptional regulator [Brevibacterium sp. UCMA 11754]